MCSDVIDIDQPDRLDSRASHGFKHCIITIKVVEGLREEKHEELLVVSVDHDISHSVDHIRLFGDDIARWCPINDYEVLVL